MTDPWAQTAPMTPQRPRGFSPGTVALIATATVLLAVAGLAIGWYAAGDDEPRTDASATPTAAVSSPAASPSPSELPSPTPAPSQASPAPAGQVMLNVLTKDFREARQEVMKGMGVSVKVVFLPEDTATAGTVVRTEPAADAPAPRGTSVTFYVAGPVFEFEMPNVVDKACKAAKDELIAAGLRIKGYPTGQEGPVRQTSVAAGEKVKWDDQVELFCSVEASPAAAG